MSKPEEKKPDQGPSQDEAEFKQIIDESKKTIANETQAPVKSKRGRPRKAPADSAPLTSEANTPQSSPTTHDVAPPPDLAPFIVQPLIMVSKGPAIKYQIPELALDKEEALACAQALDGLVKAFVPDMNAMSPKTSAVLMVGLTFGTIFVTKYSIYLDKNKNTIQAKAFESEVVEQKPIENNVVQSQDYFKR